MLPMTYSGRYKQRGSGLAQAAQTKGRDFARRNLVVFSAIVFSPLVILAPLILATPVFIFTPLLPLIGQHSDATLKAAAKSA